MTQSNFHMTSSQAFQQSQFYRQIFNFSVLEQQCQKFGIRLSKFSDAQLQSTYCMQGFKANGQKAHEICYIFISLLEQNVFSVSSYYNATLIDKKDLSNENQVSQFIKNSLQIVSSNFPQKSSIQNQHKQLERLFENLNKKSQLILKKANNEMMAVQQIKTSQEYMAVCNHSKKISQHVQQLCKTAKARQNRSRIKNENLIDLMLQVEAAKQQLQQSLYKYSGILKQINDVEGMLTKIIAQKKSKASMTDFYDEESFSQYLKQSVAIKRLEIQKKYLNK